MRIGRFTTTDSRPHGQLARDTDLAPAGESRALVALTASAVPDEPSVRYRQAAFLAHLIATKDQLPQTRERRRAEPAEAIAAYRAMNEIINRN